MGIHDLKKAIAIGVLVSFTLVLLTDQKGEKPVDKFAGDFLNRFASTFKTGAAGDYSFRYVVMDDQELIRFCESAKISVEYLFFSLNKQDMFIQNARGGFYDGQGKIVMKGTTAQSIFAVSGFYTYYLGRNGSLWIYSQAKGKFTNEFSTFATLSFTDIKGALMTGLALLAFAKFALEEGLSKAQVKGEMAFLSNNFGVAWTDENGAIIDSIFHRAQFRLADGRVGTFTVTGQIDPVTKKGYNWAQVPGGNIYAGLGGDMVDIKTLLTDAKYNDLAAAILGNKSLMVNMIVCVAGSWLLQHGKLNGVAEDIKKFLDYDVSNMPNGFYFDVIDGKVVVVPRGG